jgi:hypothetical protein
MPNSKRKLTPARRARKAKLINRHKVIPPSARLVRLGDNPFNKEAFPDRYKRMAAVLRSKTVGDALKKGEQARMRRMIRYARNHKIVRIIKVAA